jgi:hypothetical protein
LQKSDHVPAVNWVPLSEVRSSGTPNLLIHPAVKAWMQELVEMSFRGNTSAHRVERSTAVRR